MILTAAAALLIVAQQAGEAITAHYSDEPEQWTLEYPNLIGGYVEEYYACLKGGSYEVGDGRGFARQYEADIERCKEEGVELERQASARLAEQKRLEDAASEQVASIFRTVRRIHLARGADLDRIVSTGLANSRRSRADAGTNVDRVCIARVADLREQRQEFANTQGTIIEAVYRQAEYSDDDRRKILTYTNELLRLTSLLQMEMARCPGSEIAESTAVDEVPD